MKYNRKEVEKIKKEQVEKIKNSINKMKKQVITLKDGRLVNNIEKGTYNDEDI